jgi:hypothetical protein
VELETQEPLDVAASLPLISPSNHPLPDRASFAARRNAEA